MSVQLPPLKSVRKSENTGAFQIVADFMLHKTQSKRRFDVGGKFLVYTRKCDFWAFRTGSMACHFDNKIALSIKTLLLEGKFLLNKTGRAIFQSQITWEICYGSSIDAVKQLIREPSTRNAQF